jgi:F-type H+-transporting ATPase subunit epsilon
MTIPPIPASIQLEIVTPERSLLREQVDEVQIPGADGYFGVLPGHTPLLATLQIGALWYRKGQEKFYFAVAFGFAEVLPDRVTILAQDADLPEEIDVTRVQSEQAEAQQQLSRPGDFDNIERARIAMMKSLVRLQVSSRARTRA